MTYPPPPGRILPGVPGLCNYVTLLGKTNIVLAGDAVVDGVQMKFADDLDVLDENTVIFSDASIKHQYKTCVYSYLESKPDGR